VATWNLEWFFDEHTGDNYGKVPREQSAPSRDDWNWKRDGVAAAIAKMQPDILALQEVENQQVLYYLTQRLRKQHMLEYRIAFVQGSEFYTEQDVALLYRSGLAELGRWEISREHYQDNRYFSVAKHLFAKFQWGEGPQQEELVVVNVHLRARADKADLRRRQARQLNHWLRRLSPTQRNQLLILGDFNTEARGGSWQTPAEGRPTAIDQLPDLGILCRGADPQRTDLHQFMRQQDRATHLSGGQFDRILAAPGLMADDPARRDLVFRRVRVARELAINKGPDKTHWDAYWSIPAAERDLSDHYPVVAEFDFR
jgi:endonuclease/exonuclease/phosphatase family metal-dependent hydrolase